MDKYFDKNHPVRVSDDWVYSSSEECYINWKTREKFSIKHSVFVDDTADPNHCGTSLKTGDKFCVEEELRFIDEAAEKFFKQFSAKVLTGHNFGAEGDQSASVAGAAKKIVPNQALGRVIEKEANQKCSRCGELGHIYLNCHIPIHYDWDWAEYSGAKRRKIGQCSQCGETGHNRRTCGRGRI